VASQTAIHREWGGVVPAASRHVRDIAAWSKRPRLRRARRWRIRRRGGDSGPGLVGSLLVGVAFAKAFARARGIPVVPCIISQATSSRSSWHTVSCRSAAVLVVSAAHQPLSDHRARSYRFDRPHSRRCAGEA
jgi:tRNA A37 threonylcarbamoyltransferase TsaD